MTSTQAAKVDEELSSTKLEWSDDRILLKHDEYDSKEENNSTDNNILEVNLHSELKEISETNQQKNDILNKTYKFYDLINKTTLIINQMNMYSVSTSVDTIRKMNEHLWDRVAIKYEKLKLQELRFGEIIELVCSIFAEIYGEAEVLKILQQYDIDMNNAIIIIAKYILSTYHEAHSVINQSIKSGSKIMQSRYNYGTSKSSIPSRKLNLTNQKLMIKYETNELEKKYLPQKPTTISVTRRKCYACSIKDKQTKSASSNNHSNNYLMNQIVNYKRPSYAFPQGTNIIGNYIENKQPRNRSLPAKNKNSVMFIRRNFNNNHPLINNNILNFTEVDLPLRNDSTTDLQEYITSISSKNSNDDQLIEYSESNIACKELKRENNVNLLSVLKKNKTNEKRARSNLTIHLDKTLPSKQVEIGNNQVNNQLQTFTANLFIKAKRWTSCLSNTMKSIIPNLLLMLLLSICNSNLYHTNLYCAVTSWGKRKLQNILIGTLRCLER